MESPSSQIDPKYAALAETEHLYATGWRRLFASWIDGIALGIGSTVIRFIAKDLSAGDWEIVKQGIYVAYVVALTARFGMTFGKRATGVKVVDEKTGGPISFQQACIRESLPIAVFLFLFINPYLNLSGQGPQAPDAASGSYLIASVLILLWTVAELMTMLRDPRRRAIHDYLAGTVVIRY